MLNKTLFAAIILASMSSLALAQSSPQPSSPQPSNAASGESDRSFMLPNPSSGQYSEAEIQKDLAARGFFNIRLEEEVGIGSSSAEEGSGQSARSNDAGRMWTGTAQKGGKTFNVRVDAKGLVTDVTKH
jgi:hypothetical protein